ncbi:hypothetical protein [Intestinibacter bartlettii]|uniref:hypothetical protein n=1 Tax=Intestinibacter bartlettii TaxID=261299 RepID=UPI0034A0F858
MENISINEKYKLFNIPKDNQPKFGVLDGFNNFNKCSILENTNIRYFNSTETLKKQK